MRDAGISTVCHRLNRQPLKLRDHFADKDPDAKDLQEELPYVFANFDYPMLSYQHGFEKPDHRMWEVPARHLGVSPEECFFVDDFKSNIAEFMKWSGGLGISHHYDVADERYCPNGRLEEERNKLFLKMFDLDMLTFDQLIKLTFENV